MTGTFLYSLQGWIIAALTIACFGLEVFALVDALRHRTDAYTAAGKLTKLYWGLILGVATLLGFVHLPAGGLSFLSLIAVAAAAVYVTNVRPALQQVQGRGTSGPYGPW